MRRTWVQTNTWVETSKQTVDNTKGMTTGKQNSTAVETTKSNICKHVLCLNRSTTSLPSALYKLAAWDDKTLKWKCEHRYIIIYMYVSTYACMYTVSTCECIMKTLISYKPAPPLLHREASKLLSETTSIGQIWWNVPILLTLFPLTSTVLHTWSTHGFN
jgi:hypothetical protein